ncbi:unnamed protein product [Paramecium sonneborni]|uniref:Uncharacterized protein n=1 Tax=Paramecium sonneborni TaxID=65129 RepID=A0A8S1LHU9_9CILI|nr:unnamed protein product [Paramecium sonneborni]
MANSQQQQIIEQFEMLRQEKIQEFFKRKESSVNNKYNEAFHKQQQNDVQKKYFQLELMDIVYDRREIYSNKIRKMQRNAIFEQRRNFHKAFLEENQLFLYQEDECFEANSQLIGLLKLYGRNEVVQASQESDIELAVEICKLNFHEGIELNLPTYMNSDYIHQISRLEHQYSQLLQLYQQLTRQSESSQQSIQSSTQESMESSSQLSLSSLHSSVSSFQDFQFERMRQMIIRVIYDIESISSSQTYNFSEIEEAPIFEYQTQQDEQTETDDY